MIKKANRLISFWTMVLFIAMCCVTIFPAAPASAAATIDGLTISTSQDISQLAVNDTFQVNINIKNATLKGLDFGLEWSTDTLAVYWDDDDERYEHGPRSPLTGDEWLKVTTGTDLANGKIVFAAATNQEVTLAQDQEIYRITFVVRAEEDSYIRLFAPPSHDALPDSVGFVYLDADGLYALDASKINNSLSAFYIGTPPPNPTIKEISPVSSPIEVAYGTSEDDAKAALPQTTTITDSNDVTHTVNLTWAIANYQPNVSGDYNATGTFTLPAGVDQTDPPTPLQVTAIVKVLPQEMSAGLTGLTISDGSLSPDFDQNVTQYNVTVPYTVESLNVTPVADEGTIKVNGKVVASGSDSEAIDLSVGNNIITIEVTEEGKAPKTYTITVNREQPSTNADLATLAVSPGTLTPEFNPATTTYTVELPYGTTDVPDVTATAADTAATVDIQKATNLTGTEAERTTTVTVTAQDKTTKKEYKVIFSVAKQFTVTATKTQVGNRQHVTVDVNNAGSDTDAVIILALYENTGDGINEMKALIFKEAAIGAGDNNGILTGGFWVPDQYTIKAFVWDDFDKMNPLSNISQP
ncbi:MAG: cadherin-like beta sandwich domain-containing protein [Syntrophomonadaceae bacterium]